MTKAYRLTSRNWRDNLFRVVVYYLGTALIGSLIALLAGGAAAITTASLHSRDTLRDVTGVGAIVLAILITFLVHLQDPLRFYLQKRRSCSRLVTRAYFVHGRELSLVALSLTDDTVYFDNSEWMGGISLRKVERVEYSNRLDSGREVHRGYQVLRFYGGGAWAVTEFAISERDIKRWMLNIPALPEVIEAQKLILDSEQDHQGRSSA